MSELENKVEGNIKEAVGDATDDHSMEAEGAAQKGVGELQEGARKVGGAVEEAAGKVTGDRSAEVEGEAKQA